MPSSPNPLKPDLDHILAHTRPLWDDLRDARLLITGGSGFFGRWLLESFCHAIDELNLHARAVVLTRHPERFPFNHPAVEVLEGDITDFRADGPMTHVIHAATATINEQQPMTIWRTSVQGTAHLLEIARQAGVRRLLFTSSGAVYGRQPPDITHISEHLPPGPDPSGIRNAYAEAKRSAEQLCIESDIDCVIARGFAFVGPYLPLDAHFAVGNFIRNALTGGPIIVRGDGTPYRSYLYAADLAIWLWTMLVRGQPNRPYNVGSERAVTIRELAESVAALSPGLTCQILTPPTAGAPAERYVPSTQRARTELGLDQWITLPEALRRTFDFARHNQIPRS